MPPSPAAPLARHLLVVGGEGAPNGSGIVGGGGGGGGGTLHEVRRVGGGGGGSQIILGKRQPSVARAGPEDGITEEEFHLK